MLLKYKKISLKSNKNFQETQSKSEKHWTQRGCSRKNQFEHHHVQPVNSKIDKKCTKKYLKIDQLKCEEEIRYLMTTDTVFIILRNNVKPVYDIRTSSWKLTN